MKLNKPKHNSFSNTGYTIEGFIDTVKLKHRLNGSCLLALDI